MVANLRVIERGEDNIRVTWTIDEPDRQVFVRVLRSEGRFGPFEPVSDWLDASQTSRFDDGVNNQHRYRRWYYQLEVKDENDVRRLVNGPDGMPASSEFRGDRVAVAMAGDADLYYKVHGREVIYFPVRTFGDRCLVCYDESTNKKLRTGCKNCWDTTFAFGFLTPVRMYMILENAQRSTGNELGVTTATIQARMPWWVDLRPNSVIVEHENQRWHVVEPIRQITKRRVTVYQICILAEIPYGRVEWQLPVPDEIASKPVGWRYS